MMDKSLPPLPPIKYGHLNYQRGASTLQSLSSGFSATHTILGTDLQTGEQITVEDEMRERGMYTYGVQGTGKSSFLETIIHQDICKGYSVIVIDPHGDLVEHVIAQLPEERVKNTYVLDLEDTDFPFGINLFAAPPNAGSVFLTVTAERLMHVFERVFPISARMLLDKYLENIALVFLEPWR